MVYCVFGKWDFHEGAGGGGRDECEGWCEGGEFERGGGSAMGEMTFLVDAERAGWEWIPVLMDQGSKSLGCVLAQALGGEENVKRRAAMWDVHSVPDLVLSSVCKSVDDKTPAMPPTYAPIHPTKALDIPSSASLSFASLSLYRESRRRLDGRSPELIVGDVVEPVAVGVVAIGFEFDAVGFLRLLR